MAQPILFFTFANQADRHLPELQREMDEVKEALRPLEMREFIRIEREESAHTDNIMRTLADYPDRVCIFHYGGHADGQQLQLEGGSAQAKGLAQLFGGQKGLQLVFLNGCSTRDQVRLLLDQGVGAVIATSVPIGDKKAVTFSSAFYRALASKRSIGQAFEFARAAVEAKHRDAPPVELHRGLQLDEIATEEMPWGLYLQDDRADDILNWRLPYYRELGLPQHMIQYIGQQVKVNRYIVLVLDEMCRYNKDIYSQMVEVRDGEEIKRDSSTYLDLVIRNFPWIIGSQIQLLRQFLRPDRERLDQLLSTYIITSMMLYYIILSDFWDTVRRQKELLDSKQPPELQQSREELPTLDFLARFRDILRRMSGSEVVGFMPEMKTFYDQLTDPHSHLHKAWRYLEDIRQKRSNIPDSEIEQTVLTTEQAVAVVLQKAAFLADYRMLTVRSISIDNPRYGKEVYEMNLGALNAIVNTSLSLYEDADKRRKENYSNCKSIVLTPNENDLRHSINLSPFVIDKNTYLNNEHIDLYIYGYEEDGHHHYLAVKHSFYIALANEKGTDIIDTGMTEDDFAEGRNIQRSASETAADTGFGDAFGFAEVEASTQESIPVFELLVQQFQQLSDDLTPPKTD